MLSRRSFLNRALIAGPASIVAASAAPLVAKLGPAKPRLEQVVTGVRKVQMDGPAVQNAAGQWVQGSVSRVREAEYVFRINGSEVHRQWIAQGHDTAMQLRLTWEFLLKQFRQTSALVRAAGG